GVPFPADAAHQRVHNADLRANEFILHALTKSRDLNVVELEMKCLANRAHQTHIQCRAGRQPAANRDIGNDQTIKSANRVARAAQNAGHTLNIIQPIAARGFSAELKCERLRTKAVTSNAHSVVVSWGKLNPGVMRYQRRKYEASVVIRMLANQVDPARRPSRGCGRPSKEFLKFIHWQVHTQDN